MLRDMIKQLVAEVVGSLPGPAALAPLSAKAKKRRKKKIRKAALQKGGAPLGTMRNLKGTLRLRAKARAKGKVKEKRAAGRALGILLPLPLNRAMSGNWSSASRHRRNPSS